MDDMDAPTEEDCCHSDCTNCILDVYQRQLTSKILKSTYTANRVLSQIRYKPFQLVKIEASTPNANVYTFALADADEQLPFFFKPGEHAVLRNSPESPASEHLSRPYTLIPWEGERHTFSVVIKLYSTGKMSEFISRWRVGDTTYWRGPYGEFTYKPNTFKNVVMICMGTGIAPMYALAKHITEDENDETFIKLLYGSSTPEDIILRKQISQLAGFWNFECTHFISRGFQVGQAQFNENFVRGRIQREDVEAVLGQLEISKVLVLICGTDDFNANMTAVQSANGLSGKNVHVFS